MTKKQKIVKVLSRVAWLLIASGIVFVLVAAVQKNHANVCKGVSVKIDQSIGYKMISDTEIRSSLWPEKRGAIPYGEFVSTFDLYNLEKQIEKNPWVQYANLYFDQLNILHIMITQKVAVARVFDPAGNPFYLDSAYTLLPTKNSDVISLPVFTNFYFDPVKLSGKDSNTLARIVSLSKFIAADSLWSAQVESVNINLDGTFELFTQVGNQRVMLGLRDDWKNLFNKLNALYKQMIQSKDWIDYAFIDLQFKDQVVCSRKHYSVSSSDSSNVFNEVESKTDIGDSIANSKLKPEINKKINQ